MPLLLVDAANVVGSRPDGWWRDRAGAAARLVEQVRAAGLGEVVVVLEGAARPGVPEGVDVVHAPADGDSTLLALCRPGVVLVTADRELRGLARAAGADVVGPSWLLERLTPR